MKSFGGQSMVAPLRRVIVKRPEEAFRTQQRIETEWKPLAYTRPPDLARASHDHARFVSLMAEAEAEILYLPADDRTGLDSLYAHDPALITDRGAVIFQTGKVARRGEGPAFADAFPRWDVPILGFIQGAATAEAGDMIWLDQETLLVGRGFRTNAAGIQELSELLLPLRVQVVPVELPYVPLFELLTARGIQLIDVAEEEYPTLGCNVLAISPRNVIMVSGNPITRSRLESAGCKVSEFDGTEICFPGAGGPTCLTRPLLRG